MRMLCAVAFLGCAVALAATATADSPVPPSARPAPGGMRAQLSTPGASGETWTLDVYRRRPVGRITPVRIPGSIDYCLAVSLIRGGGEKRWRGITCELGAATALGIQRDPVRFNCAAGGQVLGEPAEPTPVCGLVAADVERVTVAAEDGLATDAQLSDPFRVRYNRKARILRRAGLDPERVRALPRVFRARAFLAFLPTEPTQPGERTPRLTVTATRSDGSTVTRHSGGDVFPLPPERPSLHPPRGAPQTRLAVQGTDGRRWRSTAWRTEDGGACANARLVAKGGRSLSLGCHGARQLLRNLRHGPQAYTGGAGRRGGSYPVYGFVREAAVALTVIDAEGRRWSAKLSPVFATIHRGDRSLRLKAFLVAVPGPRRALEFETLWRNGIAESTSGGLARPAR